MTAIQELTHGEGAHKVIETAGVAQARQAPPSKAPANGGPPAFVASGGQVTLDVGPDLTFRQVTVLGHWTFLEERPGRLRALRLGPEDRRG